MPDANPPQPDALSSPTRAGQTQQLVKLDGASVATVVWESLPYFTRVAWGSRVESARPERVLTYLQREASPVALSLASRSPTLKPELRRCALERLAQMKLDRLTLGRLERHFHKLLVRSRSRLLKHLSVAERVDPLLDRLDLLAEVVALRDAQAEVRSERSLVRAFRGMFQTRDPFVVWLIVCVTLLLFIGLARADPATSASLFGALELQPGWGRPWTWVTYSFIHSPSDWRHIVLNMLALILVGQVLEQVLGHLRFLIVFFACSVGGALTSVAFKALLGLPFSTVGASGAVSGLAGLALFLGLWFQSRYGRIPLRYSTSTLVGGVVLVSSVLLSATAGELAVDHGAHLGGLAVGVAIGLSSRRSLAARVDLRFAR